MILTKEIKYKNKKGNFKTDVYDNVIETKMQDSHDWHYCGFDNIDDLSKHCNEHFHDIIHDFGKSCFMEVLEGGRLDIFYKTNDEVIEMLELLNKDIEIFELLSNITDPNDERLSDYEDGIKSFDDGCYLIEMFNNEGDFFI